MSGQVTPTAQVAANDATDMSRQNLFATMCEKVSLIFTKKMKQIWCKE
jgi:hypothetical protein